MNNKQKIEELKKKKSEYEEKLKKLYIGFRGVRHEDSASEIRYTHIRVTESFIQSIEEEIKSLENSSSLA